ncbi:uncharacterized protein EV420DRAFT_1527687 [Desarmillaria tabescens]|uniref:SH3 domain-containing protein n=1 Tax=Armillaria tabescens TaxID=1929756 RepID=A0AA39NA86_ARMTA|nr:uncharacterized protein EV420DRAFT_1527687 [Desarmillaria tabescens]KAK0461858.1 hypothetical protein EV420DRAFT_1527687 [Desarmillaria tabescens]
MKYGDRQTRQSSYYLASLVLACAAWFIALVPQALLTSSVGHEAVGVLWFATIIQFFVTVGVARTFYTGGMCPHRHQIAIFASIAVVFGVIGVDRTVYSNDQRQRAMAAGWIILSIIDILWVLHFSRDTGTSGDLSRALPEAEPLSMRPSSSSSQQYTTSNQSNPPGDAMVGKHTNPLSPLPTEEHQTSSRTPDAASNVNNSAGNSRDPSDVATPFQPTRPHAPTNASDLTSLLTVTESFTSGTTTSPSIVPEYSVRAQALWTYQASPADAEELSFTANEILYVSRTPKGKWWEARKMDGSRGIVPSNYLHLLPS